MPPIYHAERMGPITFRVLQLQTARLSRARARRGVNARGLLREAHAEEGVEASAIRRGGKEMRALGLNHSEVKQ